MTHHSDRATPLALLVRVHLAALPRGRHVWAGVAATLLAVLAGALAFAPGSNGLMGFLFVAFVLVPTAAAPLAASYLRSPRVTGFADRAYTANVSPGRLLASRMIVLAIVAALHILACAPLVAAFAYAMGAGVPPAVLAYASAGALIAAHGIALGALLAALFPEGATSAPVTLAAAFSVASLLAVFLRIFTPDSTALLHVSPHVAAMAATGAHFGPTSAISSAPALAGLVVTTTVALLAGLAAWIQLREHDATGWRGGNARRRAWTVAALLLLLAPAAIAPGVDEVPHGPRGATPAGALAASVVLRGAPAFDAEASDRLAISALPFGEWSSVDILIFYPGRNGEIEDLRIDVRPSRLLEVKLASARLSTPLQAPATLDGAPGIVVRIPATVHVASDGGLGPIVLGFSVKGSYAVDGSAARAFDARASVLGVGDAHTPAFLAAGLPLPLLALGLAARRRMALRGNA